MFWCRCAAVDLLFATGENAQLECRVERGCFCSSAWLGFLTMAPAKVPKVLVPLSTNSLLPLWITFALAPPNATFCCRSYAPVPVVEVACRDAPLEAGLFALLIWEFRLTLRICWSACWGASLTGLRPSWDVYE